MSHKERVEVTEGSMEELQEHRENKTYAKRQVPLSCLGDTRRTVETIEREVSGQFINHPHIYR